MVKRLNITIDDEQYARLAQMAERVHLQPATIARSLLLSALDEAALDAENVLQLLDGLPEAHERAGLGRRQADAGETVSLDDLDPSATPRADAGRTSPSGRGRRAG